MKKLTLLEKKEQKKNALLDSAYNLFVSNGFIKTTIDDIAKKAQVAKGTFYLYFKDKDDIMDYLIVQTSYRYIKEAYLEAKNQPSLNFNDHVIYFVNCLIDRFEENKNVLKLIQKNFSWPLALKEIDSTKNDEIKIIMEDLVKDNPKLINYSQEELIKNIYIIVEMVGSVCYSAIIKNEPASMDEVKPILLNFVSKMIS